MFEILKLNSISNKINSLITDKYNFCDCAANPDGIILRSFSMHEYEIRDNLKAVARAGAGVNNIPIDKMSEKGICVFNTPGANANAVKELVILGLLLASRDVIGGICWTKTLEGNPEAAKLVEKGKAKFGGTEIYGKTLGIIGLGAIGLLVANAGSAMGMNIIGYDPYLSDYAKANLPQNTKISDLENLYKNSDYITIHVPLLPSTKEMINKDSISKMKDGVIMINFARAELVAETDALESLNNGKIKKYVVDFPTPDMINKINVIAIPHLGASTEEAEDNCAVMATKELKDYLENGNVTNSVNFPNVTLERTGAKYRTAVVFKGTSFGEIKKAMGVKAVAEREGVKGDICYAIIESNEKPNCVCKLSGVKAVRNL